MKDYKEAMQQGRDFIDANLAQCCKEELEWQNTALLCNGKLREAAAIFNTVDPTHCMAIAQSGVARQAMALAASGGNAAPALPERDGVININVYTDVDAWTADSVIAYGKACAAASAPNAALVAALEKAQEDINWMLNNRQFLNGHVFGYIDTALSAAGQEVKS